MTTADLERPTVERKLELRGANREIFAAREPEILAEAAAGTGKTRTWLELLNLLAHTYGGLRILMLRKIQATMPASCIAEFQQHVLHPGDGVYFFGGSKSEPAAFRYPNGSIIAVAGLDNSEKVLSSFWDVAYINEATDVTLADWETLTTRLRASDPEHEPVDKDGHRFIYRRLVADCNPTYASHWLMRRTDTGQTRLIKGRLQDNPAYYDKDGEPTAAGADYISKLDRLTGVRYERFRLGRRVGVENAIYGVFDRSRHVVPLEPGIVWKANIIWVDYGSRHKCSVGCLGIDQFNRRWVRECWGKPDTDQGETLVRVVGEFKERYQTNRGRVDPNQAFLAGRFGFNVAKGGAGTAGAPRLHRIDLLEPLFYQWPGGYVPTFTEDKQQDFVIPARVGSDSPGIFFVQGAPGIDEACDEIEAYHYVFNETPRGTTKDVFRDNEDHVAGIEYANEEWEEGEYFDYAAAGPPQVSEIKYSFGGNGRHVNEDSIFTGRPQGMTQIAERVG